MTSEGILLIKTFENCRLEAYRDPEGIWTIGWGSTHGVHEGAKCTQKQADQLLLVDLAETERIVLACLPKIPLSDNQLSALVSFVYNVGLGYPGKKDGFRVLKDGSPSTMLKYLLEKNFASAADEFPRWDKMGGVPCPGILRRREAEQALFLKES